MQAALAELKKGTLEVNPDEESLQRLKALRGEGPGGRPPPKAKPAFRTAQVRHWPLCESGGDIVVPYVAGRHESVCTM